MTYNLESRYRSDVDVRPTRYFKWKAYLERPLAALLFVLLLPIMLLIGLLVKLTSRGPAIFAQVRTGKYGEPFTMYKFRSMRVDAEARTGAVWCIQNDPRITKVGWWLRKLHLDELPQLWNVLRGEMSFVGPRPERPEIIVTLIDEIPGYLNRLSVKPGVTGLAQINLPPDETIEDVCRKQQLDIEYIQTANVWLDLRAMTATALRMIGLSGETTIRLMHLRRRPWDEATGGGAALERTAVQKRSEPAEIKV